ncbi:(2Fe-2S)-binding protein [Streptomyces noursei]|nr:(2Fe-2S)-binding protein [Streptomyces noursei]
MTAGRVREAVADHGARDARTVKLLTRAGMGWCQGRMCGPAVACLAAQVPGTGLPPSPERRPLAVPVPWGARRPRRTARPGRRYQVTVTARRPSTS